VAEHIKNNRFVQNFSEWVSIRYSQEFMSDSEVREYEEICKRKEILENSIKDRKKRVTKLYEQIKPNAKIFLKDAKNLILEYNPERVYNRFLTEFSQHLSYADFIYLVKNLDVFEANC
jgi:hypothetical protein